MEHEHLVLAVAEMVDRLRDPLRIVEQIGEETISPRRVIRSASEWSEDAKLVPPPGREPLEEQEERPKVPDGGARRDLLPAPGGEREHPDRVVLAAA